MLVAVIADTHLPRGARRLPDLCVDHLRRSDLILHAGDLSGMPFLDELRALGPPVHAIHGNADEPALRDALPPELVVEAGGARLGLVHDPGPVKGRDVRLSARFPGCAAVIFGHTHLPRVERHGSLWLLNPGSPTQRRSGRFHSMLLLAITSAGAVEPDLVRLS